ncbi:unnamed protein product [Polarella glacialis]|uniref:Uncharacterized protein n=1 Tax=Polarella glacialis TaxID=89957 RepID=A0A813HYK3_POLGL|nr:unnamed protein product [Polarella glacialis]
MKRLMRPDVAATTAIAPGPQTPAISRASVRLAGLASGTTLSQAPIARYAAMLAAVAGCRRFSTTRHGLAQVSSGHGGPQTMSSSERLQFLLWKAWQGLATKGRPRPSAQEIRESFAFYEGCQKMLRPPRLVIDVAAGGSHGTLSLVFRAYRHAQQALVVGPSEPSSFAHLRSAWLPEDEGTSRAAAYEALNLCDGGWLQDLLERRQINPEKAVVVASRACGPLADELLSQCLAVGVEFALAACCQTEVAGWTRGRALKDAVRVLDSTSMTGTGTALDTAADLARFGLVSGTPGFTARLRPLPAGWTGRKGSQQRRLILGLREDEKTVLVAGSGQQAVLQRAIDGRRHMESARSLREETSYAQDVLGDDRLVAPAATFRVPKQVWMLWLDGWSEAPEVSRRCLESWKLHNPEWQVRAISRADLPAWLGAYFPVHQRLRSALAAEAGWPALRLAAAESDLIRLALLFVHGGVWADATILCRRSLHCWLPAATAASGFFAFSTEREREPVMSSFLASTPGHSIVASWLRQVMVHWFTPSAARTDFGYFWLHTIFGQVVEQDQLAKQAWAATPRHTAESGRQGPHLFVPYVQRLWPAPGPEIRAAVDADASTPMWKLTNWESDLHLRSDSTFWLLCSDSCARAAQHQDAELRVGSQCAPSSPSSSSSPDHCSADFSEAMISMAGAACEDAVASHARTESLQKIVLHFHAPAQLPAQLQIARLFKHQLKHTTTQSQHALPLIVQPLPVPWWQQNPMQSLRSLLLPILLCRPLSQLASMDDTTHRKINERVTQECRCATFTHSDGGVSAGPIRREGGTAASCCYKLFGEGPFEPARSGAPIFVGRMEQLRALLRLADPSALPASTNKVMAEGTGVGLAVHKCGPFFVLDGDPQPCALGPPVVYAPDGETFLQAMKISEGQ